MDYHELSKRELRFTNRILKFDIRNWDRRNKNLIKPEDETQFALILIQAENHAFLRGIKSSVRETNLRAAGSLLRSLLESTANAHWIATDKTGGRASKYVAVIDNYSEYLDRVKANNLTRIAKDAGNWTTSSAEDRLKSFSPQAGMVWDYCSVFTHPSPTYMSLQPGVDKVLNFVIGQANTYALTTRHIMLDSSALFDINESELLNRMAGELLADKLPRQGLSQS